MTARAHRQCPIAVLGAGVLVLAGLLGAAPPAAAATYEPYVYTSVATFFGSGSTDGVVAAPSGPSLVVPAIIESWGEFEEIMVDTSPALALAVWAYFQNGGDMAQIVLSTDESPASLMSAMATFVPLRPPGVMGDLYLVPALGGLDGGDHLAVATTLAAVADRNMGLALVDPPDATVTTAVTDDDVAALVDLVADLRAVLPAEQWAHTALYAGGFTAQAGAELPAGVSAATPVPPSGVVAGALAANDTNHGVGDALTGPGARVAGVQTTFVPTNAQLGQLTSAGADAFASPPGAGIVVWGTRTLAAADPAAGTLVAQARILDYIERALVVELSPDLATVPDDSDLWSWVGGRAAGVLAEMWTDGVIGVGTSWTTPPFTVTADDTTMTPADIAAGHLILAVHLLLPDGTGQDLTVELQTATG